MAPYQNNIPLAGDLISKSQGDINGNFQALNDMYLGVNNFIKLPEQAVAPATTATQIALYTKHVGADTAVFLRNNTSGTEINFTTALKAGNGWCRLPCGILMKWGEVNSTAAGVQPINFPVAATIPVFSHVYSIQISTKYTDGDTIVYFVDYAGLVSFNVISKDVRSGGHNKAAIFTYLAIGKAVGD